MKSCTGEEQRDRKCNLKNYAHIRLAAGLDISNFDSEVDENKLYQIALRFVYLRDSVNL